MQHAQALPAILIRNLALAADRLAARLRSSALVSSVMSIIHMSQAMHDSTGCSLQGRVVRLTWFQLYLIVRRIPVRTGQRHGRVRARARRFLRLLRIQGGHFMTFHERGK